eukprot:SAG31_NODE_12634_length_928_cov_1.061520_1_plen_92_part_10
MAATVRTVEQLCAGTDSEEANTGQGTKGPQTAVVAKVVRQLRRLEEEVTPLGKARSVLSAWRSLQAGGNGAVIAMDDMLPAFFLCVSRGAAP